MRSPRLAATVMATVLLLGLLPAVGLADHAEFQLVPPAGQTAVKGNDVVGIQGTAEAGATVTDETLFALDATGAVIESYPGPEITSDGGTLSGSFTLSCAVIPGCLPPDKDPELRASIAAYRLTATVSSGAGTHEVVSQDLEFDEVDPFIVGYFLIAPDRVEVRFSEDVADPQGDSRTDWTVDGLAPTGISGTGDRRVLSTAPRTFDGDDTPEVRYETQFALPLVFPNQPYLDEAGNDLLARNRFAQAADRVPPAPPTIDAITGVATTREDGQAVPVLGNDPTPTVTIGSIEDGHTARLFWDQDGDGTLEDDKDPIIGEAVASGGTAEITWPDDLALPDGEHRLFARALDDAACDPNQASSDDCPNASARSLDALYDLDMVPPTLEPALASSSAVTAVFSEPVTGPDTTDDWTITPADGDPSVEVTGVSGSGDSRRLGAAGVLPGATLTYAATGARYVDAHGNELADTTVDIEAQDLPVVHLVDAEAIEQDGPTPPLDPLYEEAEVGFTVELSDPPRPTETGTETVTVELMVVAGTATAGDDYTDPGTITVTFTGTETSKPAPVELIGDLLDEVDETFELRVISFDNAVVGDGAATGTILDDDDPPALSVTDESVAEGDAAEVVVSLDAASGKDVVAEWSLSPGTAQADDDYEDASGSVRIPAGETEATLDVTTLQDTLDEADETFSVVLGSVVNATVDDGTATVTITDDDESPTLRISDLTVFEGDAARDEALAVTLSKVSGRDVTVRVTTSDGTATAGEDYAAVDETVTIPAGASGASVALEVLGDEVAEPDEALTATLSAPTNATIADGTADVVLLNDDGDVPRPVLTVTGGEILEDANAPLAFLFPAELEWTFTLERPDGAPDGPVQVQYATTDDGTATPGEDFEPTSGTVTIPAGETSATVTVDVIDDDLDEEDETVGLHVAVPAGAAVADGSELTFGTILDDEGLPSVAFADGSEAVVVEEGETTTLTVELDAVSGRDVTVDWATDFDGTAGTADAPAQSDTVTIPAGETTATFDVTTTEDLLEEPDETFSVVLSDPTAAQLADDRPTRSQVTIADDEVVVPTLTVTAVQDGCEEAPLPVVGGPDCEVEEPTIGSPGTRPVGFTIELDEPAEEDVLVDVSTGNGGTATAGQDFTGASSTVTIPAGETSATVDVEVLDDALDEHDETVELVLRNPRRARLQGGVATLRAFGSIIDDDTPVAVSIDDVSVTEGDPATFTVSLDAPSGKDVTVTYETDDGLGTATAGDDYVSTSGSVEIPAGETEATFPVQTLDDAADEGDETVPVSIDVAEEGTATVDRGSGELTIVDDDDTDPEPTDPPVVSLSGAAEPEGDPFLVPELTEPTELTFEVQLSKPASGEVTLNWETRPRTATDGRSATDADYTPASGQVTVADGASTGSFVVEVTPDLIDEFDQDFFVALTGVASGDATIPGDELVRTGRILDDDDPAVVGFADGSLDVGVDEGGSVDLTVRRTGATEKPITVDWAISFDGGASDADVEDPQSGTVELAPDEDFTTFTVTTAQDELDEPSEAFSVVLTDPTNATLDEDVATVTITDDDEVLPVLSVSGGDVDEGEAGELGPFAPLLISGGVGTSAVPVLEEDLVFTVTLSEAAAQDVTVRYRTVDTGSATAGSDYVATSGTLTIPAGATTGQVTVDVLDDGLDEFDETVVMEFFELQGATFSNGASTLSEPGQILDDDPLVTVDLGEDVEVGEGDPATFAITLSEVSGKDVVVRVVTEAGSAAAGSDYTAIDQTITIPAGDTEASVTVPTLDDAVVEGTEDATVRMSLAADDRAVLGDDEAVLTITDDDTAPDPGDVVVSLTGASVVEGTPPLPLPLPQGGTDLDFTITLSEPADGPVTISYETVAGTATGDVDYLSDSGSVTIPDGEDEAVVTVEVVPDRLDEFDEELRLRLTGVSGDAVIPGGQLARTGRILDDDAAAQLRVSDATVLEGQVAELDVTLNTASGKPIEVDHDTVDGTATAGDYTPVSGTLSFPPGTTTRTVQVPTLPDTDTAELIEQFELVLSGAVNAGIDDARGTISIVDVDLLGVPTVTAVFTEDTATTEADVDTIVEVPVRLSGDRDEPTTVTWSTQQLTAAEGDDYRADGGEVVVPAGETETVIPITIVGDDLDEGTEEFLVLLTQADGAVITGPIARVTIADDDGGDQGGGGDDDGGDDGGDGGDGDGEVGADADDTDGAPGRNLPATGGGAGLLVIGLAALLARRRRD